jgi:hypothetical protein
MHHTACSLLIILVVWCASCHVVIQHICTGSSEIIARVLVCACVVCARVFLSILDLTYYMPHATHPVRRPKHFEGKQVWKVDQRRYLGTYDTTQEAGQRYDEGKLR